nr:NADH-quinone oxidoreductase subunit NuoG [Armatimonadota bacterium]
VDKGKTILQAARQLGLEIPVFCYHDKLDPMGACRVCMVEASTPRGPMLVTACTTPAADGMDVNIQAPLAVKERNGIIEFMLANHPLDCPVCDRGGECDLQDNTFRFGPGTSRYEEPKRIWDDYDMGGYVARCQNRCIRCYRCVRYYKEIVGKSELGAFTRGCTTEIRTFDDRPLDFGMSGNLSEVCPVGALLDKTYLYKARPWEIRDTPTTCAHCSYGCSKRVGIRQGKVLRVKPVDNEAVNEVWLCDRGRFHHTFDHKERLTSPMLRKGDTLTPVSWDEATAYVAKELAAIIKESGPAAVGGIASGRPANEDLYAFQKFMRVAVGSNNLAHRRYGLGDAFLSAFGVEAATNTIVGLEQSKTFFLVGSDLVVTQPVMASRIRKAVRKGAKFYSADSRKLRYNMPDQKAKLRYTAGAAPAFLLGLVAVILQENLYDAAAVAEYIPHIEGLRLALSSYTPEMVSAQTGIDAQVIGDMARMLASAGGVTYLFGEEILDSPAAEGAASAIVTLALLTGSFGREDAGIVPLYQDCNAQGANDMGVRPDRLPGYVSLSDKAAREQLGHLWGAAPPSEPGLDWAGMMGAASAGSLKALLVMGNELVGQGADTEAALSKLRLLVVQDLYMTETAKMAHVVFPARSYLEKQGTFTNIERRVQPIRPALTPDNGAHADWQILAGIAEKMGKDLGLRSPASILQEISQAAPIYARINQDTVGRFGKRWEIA